jgi:predicted dehydrogenase
MRTIRIGIAGTNFISDTFLKGTAAVPGAQVTAVVSGHPEHARDFAEKNGLPHYYADLEEMLKSGQVDAVYLAVPNSLHVPMTNACIEAGLPVLTEKPFAPTAAAAREIFARAARKGVLVQDGIVSLYGEHVRALKENLARVGVVRRAVLNYTRYSSRYEAYRRGENPTTFRRALCNGAFMDLGIYCAGYAVALFGPPQSILSHATKMATGVDGSGEAILGYDTFDAVLLTGKNGTSQLLSEIVGEEGALVFDLPGHEPYVNFVDRRTGETTPVIRGTGDNFRDEIQDFITNIQEGNLDSRLVPHRLTVSILETLETCRKQAGIYYPGEEEA